jgi:Dipeptidyl peptidase IV (DPP IV) N-terminal region
MNSKFINCTAASALFFSLCSLGIAQTPLPKAGTYVCALLSEQVQFTTGLNTSLVTGETKFRVGSDKNMTITASRAPFDIVLRTDGVYTLTNVKTNGGTYKYNPQTSKVSFTGDLTLLNFKNYFVSKNIYVLQFDSNTGLHWQCELGAQTNELNPKADLTTPGEIFNRGLKGTITTTVSNQSNHFLAKVFELNLSNGNSTVLFPDGVAARNLSGDILYFDKSSRLKITDRTGTTTVRQLSDKTNNGFDDMYPAISSSGDYIALTLVNRSKTGTMNDLVANGVKVVVMGTGNQIVNEFVGYQHPAWTPDGGLIVVGDGKSKQGVYSISADFKSIKRLVENYPTAQYPAVSSDSQNLAFVYNNDVWVFNFKTNLAKKVVYGTTAGFPAWSPDGKYLAVNAIDPTSKRWFVYISEWAIEKGFWVKDSNGNFVESRNRISWLD